MPKLIQVGNRIVNIELMTDAEYTAEFKTAAIKSPSPKLEIMFAAPQPTGVGASDWATEAHTVVFRGEAARKAWNILGMMAEAIVQVPADAEAKAGA